MPRKPALFTGRRVVLLLAASQALMLSAIVLSMGLAAVLGAMLAPDNSLATLPVAAMVIGAALLAQTCRPAEQLKVQAFNEFVVLALLASVGAEWRTMRLLREAP